MSKSNWKIIAAMSAMAVGTILAVPANAQTQSETVKPKPPMFTYVSNWQIPRAHWADMRSPQVNDNAMLDKAVADGSLVGYGNDENLVHTPDGWTHDGWFSSMSMGGLMSVLKQYYNAEDSTPAALLSSTKHWDEIVTSRYYGWHSGAYKDAFISVAEYKLKDDAPDNALDAVSGEVVAPLLEKLLADGTLVEYEIDTMAVHTSAPGTFWIVTVSPQPGGLDKIDDAIRDAIKSHPVQGMGFEAVTDHTAHRDELEIGSGTFK